MKKYKSLFTENDGTINQNDIYQYIIDGFYFTDFSFVDYKTEIDKDFFGEYDIEEIKKSLPSNMYLFGSYASLEGAKNKDVEDEGYSGWVLETDLKDLSQFKKI